MRLLQNQNKAITYIVACAVLHNLGIQRGDVMPNPDGNVAPINDDLVLNHGRNDGLAMRQHIVNNFFKNFFTSLTYLLSCVHVHA